MFKFVKSIFNGINERNSPTKPMGSVVNHATSNQTVNYDESFSCILKYSPQIAGLIKYKNVPKYAINWLAESIRNGVEIEISAIYYSIEKHLPYLCETEMETWLFDTEENPLQGSTEGIFSLILQYGHGQIANQNKLNYWINRLINMADNNDHMAKGLICWRGDILFSGINIELLKIDELIKKYESELMISLNNGDPYAKLAVAEYKRELPDAERQDLFLSAIDSGLTDACFYYVKYLNLKRFEANGMTVNMPQYGTDEWQAYMKDELSLYKKGAELDNGIMAGYCQYRLGDMYANGDGGVLKDAATAQIWFKRAVDNGYEKAKVYIN